MIAFPSMLVPAATDAGMKVPPDPDSFDRLKFPHFQIFCNAQLVRAMTAPGEHWENAKKVAKIPDDEIMDITLADLVHKYGFITTDEV
jgi:hypothetical protein